MLFQNILIEILCTFSIAFLTAYNRIFCDLNPTHDKIQLAIINAFYTVVFIMICYPQIRCHFSPTLTISDIIYKNLPFENGMMIILSQFVGGLIAAACIILTLSGKEIQLIANKSVVGMPMLNSNFTTLNGFLIDLVLNSFFVFVNLTFSDYSKKERDSVTRFAMIRAVTIFVICLAGESICGIDSNPFSVFAGALLTKNYRSYQWIYILSSIMSSYLGGFIYKPEIFTNLFVKQKKSELVKDKIE